MGKGKSTGQDREYQVLCRDILIKLNNQLQPFSQDGIDIAFIDVGGTTITYDIALKNASGELVVAECRRYSKKIRQEDLFAFAYRVEILRKAKGLSVSGIFFTKTDFQIGSVKNSSFVGIQAVVLKDNQATKDFVLTFHSYDSHREQRIKNAIAEFSASIQPKASISIKVIRADGSEEDLGNVG